MALLHVEAERGFSIFPSSRIATCRNDRVRFLRPAKYSRRNNNASKLHYDFKGGSRQTAARAKGLTSLFHSADIQRADI